MASLMDHASVDLHKPDVVQRALKITVLSGGPSAERDVSLKSGKAVSSALRSLGHEVYCADISPEHLETLDVPTELVFIALHGTFGEDGQLQEILDQRGIRYCGSGAQASALAMDKAAAKSRFIESGIPTPAFDLVTFDSIDSDWALPVVVKPVAEGSSVDCRIVFESGDLHEILSQMIEQYGRCLVEQYVKGLELTVGILGDQALPPIQIRTRREYYNYEAKYLDDDTEYLFDIDLPPALLDEIKTLSVKAHQALGCRDFSRVDWLVDEQTHQPYVLEINTIPGFTDHSLLPKAAARAGLSFPDLCQRIVELAFCR